MNEYYIIQKDYFPKVWLTGEKLFSYKIIKEYFDDNKYYKKVKAKDCAKSFIELTFFIIIYFYY